eukprot:jgi/Botrbrau1/11739/Bobra.0195s0066.1
MEQLLQSQRRRTRKLMRWSSSYSAQEVGPGSDGGGGGRGDMGKEGNTYASPVPSPIEIATCSCNPSARPAPTACYAIHHATTMLKHGRILALVDERLSYSPHHAVTSCKHGRVLVLVDEPVDYAAHHATTRP